MTPEELKLKYLHLLQRVELMRDNQKMYFQYKVQSQLDSAKRLEREVDAFIAKEKKEIQSGQQKLF